MWVVRSPLQMVHGDSQLGGHKHRDIPHVTWLQIMSRVLTSFVQSVVMGKEDQIVEKRGSTASPGCHSPALLVVVVKHLEMP